jgi:hypothetical protein
LSFEVVDEFLKSTLLYVETVPQGPVLLGRSELEVFYASVWRPGLPYDLMTHLGRRDGLGETDEWQRQIDEAVLVLFNVLLAVNDLWTGR